MTLGNDSKSTSYDRLMSDVDVELLFERMLQLENKIEELSAEYAELVEAVVPFALEAKAQGWYGEAELDDASLECTHGLRHCKKSDFASVCDLIEHDVATYVGAVTVTRGGSA